MSMVRRGPGRPRKYGRASRAVTVTLPDDVIARLGAIDADLGQAIVAAVKFDDDCFRYFSYGSGEAYLENVALAVTRAAENNPPYLEATYNDARDWVAYNMK